MWVVSCVTYMQWVRVSYVNEFESTHEFVRAFEAPPTTCEWSAAWHDSLGCYLRFARANMKGVRVYTWARASMKWVRVYKWVRAGTLSPTPIMRVVICVTHRHKWVCTHELISRLHMSSREHLKPRPWHEGGQLRDIYAMCSAAWHDWFAEYDMSHLLCGVTHWLCGMTACLFHEAVWHDGFAECGMAHLIFDMTY